MILSLFGNTFVCSKLNEAIFLCLEFRGTEEHFDIMGRVTIINSTLGKALGGAAGWFLNSILNLS